MELKKPLNEEGNPDLDELLRYLSFYGAWGEGYTGHLPVDEYSYVPYFEIDGKKVECSTLQTKKVSH